MRIALAASALLLAAAPGAANHARDDVPVATPAGKPIDCLSLSSVRESRVRSDGQTIDFYVAGGKVYRSTLDGGKCPGLALERRFAHKSSGNQICAIDTITVLQSPELSRGASCGLGEFQPVTLAKTR